MREAGERQVGMNRPDKAGEPSMEEILASIRQIIADDPATDRPAPVIEANPFVPQSPSADRTENPKPEEIRPPLLDRLSGVLKSGPLPATSPLGSKRLLSFDQDLADMFDEPENGRDASAAPKPEIRVPAEFTAKAQSSDAASRITTDGAAASPPAGAPPASLSIEEAPETPLPPPPRSFGFPPLRKQGFIPPAQTPVLPPIPAVEPASASSATASSDDEPVSLDEALKRISGLGAVVPGSAAARPSSGMNGSSSFGAATPSFVMEPAFTAEQAAVEPQRPDPSLSMGRSLPEAEATPSSSPSLATPAAYRPGYVEPAIDAPAPRPATNGFGFGAPNGMGASNGMAFSATAADLMREAPTREAPLREQSPFGGAPDVGAAPSEPRYASEPIETAVAAHALDALAQGLAASAAASVAQSAIPLVNPVIEPEPARAAHVPASNSLTTTALMGGGGAGPGRTLEDAVADMLRPMLQQWVADNMPRIIERALRTEVAKTVKPGNTPSGS
jgi:cell pole-organizing protein PopZ